MFDPKFWWYVLCRFWQWTKPERPTVRQLRFFVPVFLLVAGAIFYGGTAFFEHSAQGKLLEQQGKLLEQQGELAERQGEREEHQKKLVQAREELEMKIAQEREESWKRFLATPTPASPEDIAKESADAAKANARANEAKREYWAAQDRQRYLQDPAATPTPNGEYTDANGIIRDRDP